MSGDRSHPTPQTRRDGQGLRRRHLLIGGALGIGALLAVTPIALRPTEDALRGILSREFGAKLADSAVTQGFVRDAAQRLRTTWTGRGFKNAIYRRVRRTGVLWVVDPKVRDELVALFLLRTNAYRVYLGLDEDLVYATLDPYEAGCSNFLSSAFRPPENRTDHTGA